MRIVADTNVLIASIFWNGTPYDIIKHALEGKTKITVF
jgi:predicted nucleic acid-binding protein